MRIDQAIDEVRPCFSFEFFPPKTDEGMENLWNALSELRHDEPTYVSVTYGAGGSTRDRTIDITKRIKSELGIEAMALFGGGAARVDGLKKPREEMGGAGLENVLARGGPPPQGEEEWTATEG